MRILVLHRQNSAVGYYRLWLRARRLQRLGHEVTWWEDATYKKNLKPKKFRSIRSDQWAEKWLVQHLGDYDLLIVDRAIDNKEWATFAGFKHYSPDCRMWTDFDDDFTNVPDWNPSYMGYQPGQEPYEAGHNHLKVSEMVTVSTQPLLKAFEDKCHRIRLVPNLIDPEDWEQLPVDPARVQDPYLRVLYGGAAGHYGDLEAVKDGLQAAITRQVVPWRLICFGAIPDWLRDLAVDLPGKVVGLPWVPFQDYAKAVAWGGFDLAIAPLRAHPFNETKSNIKWLEAGIQRIPFVCSDIGPYSQIPSGCAMKVENKTVAWATALRDMLTDKFLRSQFAKAAYEAVKDEWTIDKGDERLQNLVQEAMDSPRIETVEDTRLPNAAPVELE